MPRLPGELAVPAVDRAEWQIFKSRFVTLDGRLVDTGNHGVSHSEGQGVGMLLATAFDDRDAFDRIHDWTVRHLRRTDALHAWRWLPDQPIPVPDTNNATDGDLYIAGALNRAFRRWQSPAYAAAARNTAQAILDRLVMTVAGWTVLLPGARGFDKPSYVTINLSYYIFPLLAELNAACPSPLWAQLQRHGAALIEASRFGAWALPPDWLEIRRDGGSLAPARDFPARFSYDALRVPLFLAWSGRAPAVIQTIAAFWRRFPRSQPHWADLQTNRTGQFWGGGAQAIAALTGRSKASRGDLPLLSFSDDYYSSSLVLLSRLALREAPAPLS